jgi:hypothetical protein
MSSKAATAKRGPGRPSTKAQSIKRAPVKPKLPPIGIKTTTPPPVVDDLLFPEVSTDIAPATPFVPNSFHQTEDDDTTTYVNPLDDSYMFHHQDAPLHTPALYPFMNDDTNLPPLTEAQIQESEDILHELIRKSAEHPTSSPPQQEESDSDDDDNSQSDDDQQQEESSDESDEEEYVPPPPLPPSKPSKSVAASSSSSSSRKRIQRQPDIETKETDGKAPKRQRQSKPRVPFTKAIPDEEGQFEFIQFCAEHPVFFDLIRKKFPGLTDAVYKEQPDLAKHMKSSRRIQAVTKQENSKTKFPLPSFFKHTPNKLWKNFTDHEGNPLWNEEEPEEALNRLCPRLFSRFSSCERLPVFQRKMTETLTPRFFELLSKHMFQLKYQSSTDGPTSDRLKMLYLNRNGSDILPITPILNNITNFQQYVDYCNALSSHPEMKELSTLLSAFLISLRAIIPQGFSQATLMYLNQGHKGCDELRKVLHPSPYTFIALPFPDASASKKPNVNLRFRCEYGDHRQFTFKSTADQSNEDEKKLRAIEFNVAYHVLPFFNGAVTDFGSELTTSLNAPVLVIAFQ